jgi:hypothetical protein
VTGNNGVDYTSPLSQRELVWMYAMMGSRQAVPNPLYRRFCHMTADERRKVLGPEMASMEPLPGFEQQRKPQKLQLGKGSYPRISLSTLGDA